jgi:hypothetical protein
MDLHCGDDGIYPEHLVEALDWDLTYDVNNSMASVTAAVLDIDTLVQHAAEVVRGRPDGWNAEKLFLCRRSSASSVSPENSQIVSRQDSTSAMVFRDDSNHVAGDQPKKIYDRSFLDQKIRQKLAVVRNRNRGAGAGPMSFGCRLQYGACRGEKVSVSEPALMGPVKVCMCVCVCIYARVSICGENVCDEF